MKKTACFVLSALLFFCFCSCNEQGTNVSSFLTLGESSLIADNESVFSSSQDSKDTSSLPAASFDRLNSENEKSAYDLLSKLQDKVASSIIVYDSKYSNYTKYIHDFFSVVGSEEIPIASITDNEEIKAFMSELETQSWVPAKAAHKGGPNVYFYLDKDLAVGVYGELKNLCWMSIRTKDESFVYVVPKSAYTTACSIINKD